MAVLYVNGVNYIVCNSDISIEGLEENRLAYIFNYLFEVGVVYNMFIGAAFALEVD